jgi:ABC-type multidrug transport system ATPase subunit
LLFYIFQISKSRTTIVITTHYIEEARQANVVGMMRFGKLLSEDCPTKLLRAFDMPTLEDVFLHLCHRDETERGGEELKQEPEKPVRKKNNI